VQGQSVTLIDSYGNAAGHYETSQEMNRTYRITTVLTGLTVSILALVAAAPSAFTMRLVDPGDSAPYVATLPVTHSGMAAWQIAFTAGGAAVAAVVLTAAVLPRRRGRPAGLHRAARYQSKTRNTQPRSSQ
jgi:hypothetical protein